MTRTPLLYAVALSLAAVQAASAQTQITGPGGLSAGDAVFTNPDTAGTVRIGSTAYGAPGLTLTFGSNGDTLEVDRVGKNYFGSAFPTGTTVTYAGGYQGAQAPLAVAFSKPVSEFGFGAEEFSAGTTVFSFSFYNGSTLVGSFTATGTNSFDPNVPGVLAFIGGRAPSITSVLIADDSENNIAVGPISYAVAGASVVPEPSTAALALAGLAGAAVLGRRRSRAGAPTA